MRKLRILFVNEFSQLMTGFSTYMHYVIPRLHATGKYEIAELATYVDESHPAVHSLPWKVYPNNPPQNIPEQVRKGFESDPVNQFGRWTFDSVVMDYKPDVVISIRDWWMDCWIQDSPLRSYFQWIEMPTVDGEPQKKEWLDTYHKCDKLLTYSQWGKNIIERERGIEVSAVASPGSDVEIFKPSENKAMDRNAFGLPTDAFVVQTVMRNQPRKLYTELFKAFNKYLDLCKENGQDELAQKSFLHCHTSYPDVGWDFPTELKNHKVSHKVLFTYMCGSCGTVFAQQYGGEKSHCLKCRQHTALMPNTARGVDRTTLARIMGISDIYVQYSICEGWGMPISDAKACGVPIMAVDYSAMSEQCYNGGGIPIKVQRFFQEAVNQTNQLRAYPDNDDLAQKLYDFATSSKEDQEQLGKEARECIDKYYTWDRVSEIWESVLDEMKPQDEEQVWLKEANIIEPHLQFPPNLSNEQFIMAMYTQVLQQPELIHSSEARKFIECLNLGYEPGIGPDGKPVRHPVNRDTFFNHFMQRVQKHNQMEQIRYQKITGQTDDQERQEYDCSVL